MKKYGLQLRTPPNQQKKTALKPPFHPRPSIFGEDDDDDVTKEISRQASKSRALQIVDEQQKKALAEDPLAFDYDGVYDEMKSNAVRSRIQDHTKREPKYIASIIENVKKREREHEVIYERKLLKERTKDDHLYEDKEKFITSAYKKKLAEHSKWTEEERLRQLHEEKEDVTKKSDLTDFYFSLNKNVAFGARSAHASKSAKEQSLNTAGKIEGSASNTEAVMLSKQKSEQGDEQAPASDYSEDAEGKASTSKAMSATSDMVHRQEATSEQDNTKASSQEVSEDKKADQETGSEVDAERFKRGEDALTAARERFLARKKAKNTN